MNDRDDAGVGRSIGSLKRATVVEDDGSAHLFLGGEDGEIVVEVPAHMVTPLQHTVREVSRVYGDHTLLEGSHER